jgi:prepilin-type N-terminal cleavage/methylation domain-containing protein/prepilin-type processing-associated H-X9-DG protein
MIFRSRRTGFTLIELLIVITIIGLLIAMLMVAVQASRKSTRLMTCQSNMRQWTIALQNYAQAHQGYLPRRGQGIQIHTTILNRPDDWFNALPPFMESDPLITRIQNNQPPHPGENSPWMCPELAEPVVPAGDPTADPSKMYFAYGMNMWLSAQKPIKSDNIDRVGPRSKMVFLSEGDGFQCSVLPSTKLYSPVARHHDQVNLAFLDGRVAAYSSSYVGCGVGIPDRPDINWIVPESDWSGPSN